MYHKTFQEGELYMHRRSLEGFVKLESLISSGEEKWVSHMRMLISTLLNSPGGFCGSLEFMLYVALS